MSNITKKFEGFLRTEAVEKIIKNEELLKWQHEADAIYKQLEAMLPEEGKRLLLEFEDLQSTYEAQKSILYYLSGVEDSKAIIKYFIGSR